MKPERVLRVVDEITKETTDVGIMSDGSLKFRIAGDRKYVRYPLFKKRSSFNFSESFLEKLRKLDKNGIRAGDAVEGDTIII